MLLHTCIAAPDSAEPSSVSPAADGRFVKIAASDGRSHAAAALHHENQRLHARLRAQMDEVRASRARLLAAADAERRRLERDLHDGAQARFVAVALHLRRAQAQAPPDSDIANVLETAIAELANGLDELRELARGIHPAVLTERGLDAALRSLALRAPLPVEVRGEPGGRLPAAVEAAAYFAVSEALQNVAKYADAGHATVEIRHEHGRLVVDVTDDGRGGARPGAGSGLDGLADRVGALDGRLEVHSPLGAGTRVHVEIPSPPPVDAREQTPRTRRRRALDRPTQARRAPRRGDDRGRGPPRAVPPAARAPDDERRPGDHLRRRGRHPYRRAHGRRARAAAADRAAAGLPHPPTRHPARPARADRVLRPERRRPASRAGRAARTAGTCAGCRGTSSTRRSARLRSRAPEAPTARGGRPGRSGGTWRSRACRSGPSGRGAGPDSRRRSRESPPGTPR